LRPGSETLELLANPLNATILECLGEGSKRLAELRKTGGAAPQTTVRAHLKGLESAGLATLEPREGSPQILEWTLTDAGRDLLEVVGALNTWLEQSPDGPLILGSDAGKMAVKALVGGWSSTILCLLVAGPLTLTDLARCIHSISYPALERRLSSMRLAGQVRTAEGDGQGKPYEVTEWLQQGVEPLAAAVRWEYTHRSGNAVPLSRSDTEAGFLLALPLLRLAMDLRGTCKLGVQVDDEDGSHCGARAEVADGKVISCAAELGDNADSLATGSPTDWAQAMLEASASPLELNGDRKLARGLVDGLHARIFGTASSKETARFPI
jgi:DNA-binding HxlR family transcriptional regulator